MICSRVHGNFKTQGYGRLPEVCVQWWFDWKQSSSGGAVNLGPLPKILQLPRQVQLPVIYKSCVASERFILYFLNLFDLTDFQTFAMHGFVFICFILLIPGCPEVKAGQRSRRHVLVFTFSDDASSTRHHRVTRDSTTTTQSVTESRRKSGAPWSQTPLPPSSRVGDRV